MYYYANLSHTNDGITVTFRDIPEAITCGQSETEAIEMAEDVLISSIEAYFWNDRVFPIASTHKKDEKAIYLPESIYAKVLLHNVTIEQGINKAELARMTGFTPSEIQRLLNPRHTTKIDTIGKALAKLGKPLQLSIE